MAERYDTKGRKLRQGETYDEKSGRYRYSYTDTTGKRRSVYSWTLTSHDTVPAGCRQKSRGESLREKEDIVRRQIDEQLDTAGGNMTVLELMKRYTNLVWKNVKETTRNGYRTQLKFMENEPFARRKIKTITPLEAEEWFQSLHDVKGKNYSTLHTLRGILRPAFAMAKKNNYVVQNPFDFPMLKKRYGGTKTRHAISRRDMNRFLDFCRTDKHFSIYFNRFYCLFFTGLRVSELCGLTRDDIDFANHVVHVRRQLLRLHNGKEMILYIETLKTEAGNREVPMTEDLERVFKDVIEESFKQEKGEVIWDLEHQESATGFLWRDKNGTIEVAQHIQNHMRWCADKFNRTFKDELPPLSPHVARHTYCSLLASTGISPKTLQRIMGHSDIAITMNVYTTLEDRDVREAFFSIAKNNSHIFYELDRVPETFSPNLEDYEEEPEVNFDEAADDDD